MPVPQPIVQEPEEDFIDESYDDEDEMDDLYESELEEEDSEDQKA